MARLQIIGWRRRKQGTKKQKGKPFPIVARGKKRKKTTRFVKTKKPLDVVGADLEKDVVTIKVPTETGLVERKVKLKRHPGPYGVMVKEKKNAPKLVHIKFQSGFVDTRKGKGWVAILKVNKNGEIEREFLDINKIWGKKGYKFTFEKDLPEGTILEISEGGSWKNKYRYFCEVDSKEEDGLKSIGHYQSISAKEEVFEKLGASKFAKVNK